MNGRLLVVVGLSLAACSRSPDAADRGQNTPAAEPASTAAARDTAGMPAESGMSGMSGMPGMSDMPGMSAESGARAPMVGMDHAQMTPAAAGGMPEMDHGAMAGMDMSPSEMNQPGSDRLLTLVSELLKDPIVRREIDADPTLREAWADTSVTRIILQP